MCGISCAARACRERRVACARDHLQTWDWSLAVLFSLALALALSSRLYGDVLTRADVSLDATLRFADLVQTGGTLFECAKKVKAEGALSVSVFCTHAVFPDAAWRRFAKVSVLLCTVTFNANLAHNLTRSP